MAPEWLEGFLRECPKSPSGVHQWLARAAHKTFPFFEEKEQVKVLRWSMRDCGRNPQPREIESTVSNIRARRKSGEADGSLYRAWPLHDHAEIDLLVRTGVTVAKLREKSPHPITEVPPFAWLERLFPANSLVCMAQEHLRGFDSCGVPSFYREWHTRIRDNWCCHELQDNQLIVPSPARWTWGWTQDRRRSSRCNDMFPCRRFLVVEFDFSIRSRDGSSETAWALWIRGWEKAGRSIRDACAALILHLSQYAPLVLVVWSGGKSLQAWFSAWKQSEQTLRTFMEYAVMLGADSATWTRCQLVRTPEAIRSNRNRQAVEYFDSSSLPESPHEKYL
jgi:hypothetical protein